MALLLKGKTGRIFNLVLHYRPPTPGLALEEGTLLGEPKTPFQRQLQARVKGPLAEARQLKLDRVALFRFAGERGFVDTPLLSWSWRPPAGTPTSSSWTRRGGSSGWTGSSPRR